MYDKDNPMHQPIGIAHHIPISPNLLLKIHADGIRIIHNAISEINMGINVSPAPRITPAITNIDENTI